MTDANQHSETLPEVEVAPDPKYAHRVVALVSLGAAVVFLILFGWVADSVRDLDIQTFDWYVRGAVHDWASPGLTRAMIWISFLGHGGIVIAVPIAVIVFLILRWRRAALWLILTMAGAAVLDLTLKYSFHRSRPAPFFVVLPHTPSFPSGHSLFSFCFYGVLAGLLTARLQSLPLRVAIWTVAALLVAAIGLSRIYLGVHYPSDVIAGYLTAAMWISAMIALDRSWKHRRLCK